MSVPSSVPVNSSKKDTKAINKKKKHETSEKQAVTVGSFSVDKTFRALKVKIEKPEDEEKEKMSFCPKGNCNLMHYLCKHHFAKLAGEQGWKLILENIDDKLVVKLLIRNETPIEKCRDKVREVIVKSLPHLHQETFNLSPLSSKRHSNSSHEDMKSINQGPDPDNKDSLAQALAYIVPLVSGVQNQADVFYDRDLNSLVITGATETVKQLYMKAKRKLYTVTMETVLESASQGHLLRAFGVMDQLRGQYPNVQAVVQDCNTKMSWTGTEENITLCRQELEKFIREIKTDSFQLSSVMKMLILRPEIKSLINCLLQKEGIVCVWQVTETGQIQVWSMKSLSAKHFGLKIRENFKEESFLVKEFPFVLEVSKTGFGLSAAEMIHFAVEETRDTVNVAATSDTMQKIIWYLQDLENQQTSERQFSVSEGGDNSREQTKACTIEVRGMDKQISDDMVELYFESRRAAGHPVDIEKFDASKRENDGVIFITYKTAEVAQLVLERQHTLGKSSLTVGLFEKLEPVPSQFYQKKIFFRNMNQTTTQNSLESFLRSKIQVSAIEFLFGKENGTVLVSFDGTPDFEKLEHSCQKSPLDKCFLEVNRVPVSHSILVTGVSQNTILDTLENYFENASRSVVTDAKEISDRTFVISFEDNTVIDRVCERSPVIDGCKLTVQIYYEMLGYRQSYTHPSFKVPSPLVLTDTDPSQIQFIMATDTAELEKQLSNKYAKLHWPEDVTGHVKLECLITEDVADGHSLVLSWEEVVKDIMSRYLAKAKRTKAQVVIPKLQPSANVTGSKKAFSKKKKTYTGSVGDSTLRFSKSYHESQQSWQPPSTIGYGNVGSKDFTTAEGLLVRVYSGSILHLDVDCIVKAANGDLQHGGGVAFVISNAAGYEFDKESRDYITRFGPLRVGEVCTTTAGNLKYKGVIHAVGPRWYEYSQDQKRECLDDLKTAVKNSLEEADIQRFTSIAIPAISSGIFAVPKEHCTQQYYRAVEEYSKNRGKHATLTEVHFIDKDIQMCQLIQTTFTKCFGSSRITSANLSASAGAASSRTNHLSHSFSQPSRQSVPAYHRSQSFSSDERLSGDDSASSFNKSDQDQGRNKNLKHNLAKESKIQYQIGNNLTFHFVIGDITEAITEAIVNPENKLIDSRGRIARAIMKIGGERYQTDLVNCHMLKKLKMTDAIETLAGNCSWKYVLHVVAPRWGQDAVKENQTYERNLQQSYENILCLMDKLKLTSLAMPILGTGDHGYTTPYNTIANVLLAVSKQFAERIQKRKDVFVYCIDKTLLKPMIDVFDERFGESELPAADQKTNTLAEQTEKDIGIKDNQVAVKITENCCICMDTIDKPKKLSCGHVFCTECIDQQFKYKPVCPQCGAVHGKITGDQPPGTMTMRTLKSYGKDGGLPGYNGYDIISITYNFPPGRQGPDHPTPGKNYQGITRPAYLPDNEKGRLVAKLLKIAFDRKLVFTIGSSRTTGQDGVVTWNDIHHKTRIDGGPQAFGYPDPTYLDRVLDELKAKGVTKESLNDP